MFKENMIIVGKQNSRKIILIYEDMKKKKETGYAYSCL